MKHEKIMSPETIAARIVAGLEKSFAEWVRGYGPGHTLRWMDEELWPYLTHRISDEIRADRIRMDSITPQKKMEV